MTDKEKLLSLISEMQDHGLYYGEHGFGIHVENERLADHLIQSGVMSQRWIPVTDGLPERFETVVVCLDNNTRSIAYLSNGDVWIAMWVLSGVTHWMPLPDPPKGGS